jgi:hypothetical protein
LGDEQLLANLPVDLPAATNSRTSGSRRVQLIDLLRPVPPRGRQHGDALE